MYTSYSQSVAHHVSGGTISKPFNPGNPSFGEVTVKYVGFSLAQAPIGPLAPTALYCARLALFL